VDSVRRPSTRSAAAFVFLPVTTLLRAVGGASSGLASLIKEDDEGVLMDSGTEFLIELCN
jgi:hypothetical protein